MRNIAHQDKTLICQDCGNEFTFTAAEQDFYQQKEFTNEPKRCPNCRKIKKEQFRGNRGGGGRGYSESFQITCANCGKTDTVPFKPRGDRPVLCSDCFKKQRDGGQQSRHKEQPAPVKSETADMQQGEEIPVEVPEAA